MSSASTAAVTPSSNAAVISDTEAVLSAIAGVAEASELKSAGTLVDLDTFRRADATTEAMAKVEEPPVEEDNVEVVSPIDVEAEAALEAAVAEQRAAAEHEADAAMEERAAGEVVAPAVSERISKLAKVVAMIASSTNSLDHPAVTKPAAEHTEKEIRQAFAMAGEAVTDLTEAVAELQAAKELFRADPAAFGVTLTSSAAPPTASEPAPVIETKKKRGGKKDKSPAPSTTGAPAAVTATSAAPAVRFARPPLGRVKVSVAYLIAEGQIKERTQKIPLPNTVFCEADPEASKPNWRKHQVDPSRGESYTPVMPNLALLSSSGNPYPKQADETVVTAERFRNLVCVSRATYELLVKRGELALDDAAAQAEAISMAGVGDTKAARRAFSDTLADLSLFGVAVQREENGKRFAALVAK